MQIEIELSDEDVALLDVMARVEGSRSAAMARAIAALREQLGMQYQEAWKDWEESGDAALWDRALGDGILDEEG